MSDTRSKRGKRPKKSKPYCPQEALTNIRKHGRVHTVRIQLRCRNPGSNVMLLEDDGVGFSQSPVKGHPGEHIGLSIMEERAHRFGADLRIESEPGIWVIHQSV